jgi:hypothetical protein
LSLYPDLTNNDFNDSSENKRPKKRKEQIPLTTQKRNQNYQSNTNNQGNRMNQQTMTNMGAVFNNDYNTDSKYMQNSYGMQHRNDQYY